jgi:Histidine kinase-like ATPase domain
MERATRAARVSVAVTEAAANAVLHRGCDYFEVTAHLTDESLIITVSDPGQAAPTPATARTSSATLPHQSSSKIRRRVRASPCASTATVSAPNLTTCAVGPTSGTYQGTQNADGRGGEAPPIFLAPVLLRWETGGAGDGGCGWQDHPYSAPRPSRSAVARTRTVPAPRVAGRFAGSSLSAD